MLRYPAQSQNQNQNRNRNRNRWTKNKIVEESEEIVCTPEATRTEIPLAASFANSTFVRWMYCWFVSPFLHLAPVTDACKRKKRLLQNFKESKTVQCLLVWLIHHKCQILAIHKRLKRLEELQTVHSTQLPFHKSILTWWCSTNFELCFPLPWSTQHQVSIQCQFLNDWQRNYFCVFECLCDWVIRTSRIPRTPDFTVIGVDFIGQTTELLNVGIKRSTNRQEFHCKLCNNKTEDRNNSNISILKSKTLHSCHCVYVTVLD